MNWLDIVIIIFLVGSVIMGLRSGLIRILFMLAGVIIGVVLAGRYSPDLAVKLSFISDIGIAGIVAFLIIVVGTLIVAMILAFIVERLSHWALVGWVDHLGGAILGLLLGGISIGAILAMWLMWEGPAGAISGSVIAKFLVDKFWVVLALLPSYWRDAISPVFG